ncbi:hypothetical protein RCO48_09140 [Peribacillus frigoritolerans]|nr:hypothetical protein [Peribacillus frigoritolerans]
MSFITDPIKSLEDRTYLDNQELEDQAKLLIRNKAIPSRYKFDYKQVMQVLSERIYGQEKVMESLENMLKNR